MTWTKFESRFPFHRKIRKLSDAAFRLHVSGICWCNDNGTDGFIPADDLDLVSDIRNPTRAVTELVRRDLWHPATLGADDLVGWMIHDYLQYQEDAETLKKRRDDAAERQRRSRESRRDNATGRLGRAS